MNPLYIVVDLFCGAGGVTTGIEQATYIDANGTEQQAAIVVACVNHDAKAIESHWKNHAHVVHFEEDIRKLKMSELVKVVQAARLKYPGAQLVLWASLECTNFSKAKGGQPRNADSRTLAEHLYKYVHAIDPDFIQIENVVEFMSWGPLDANGKPLSRKNGQDWMRWRGEMCSMGYHDQWKEMNSANYGAYTSRNRLFGCFAKHGLPIVWPEPTHAKKPSKHGMHGDLKAWKAVKEVLDFEDEGESIFNRKKPLVEATFSRIYAGLVKFVAGGDTSFITKYYSGRPDGKVISTDGPAGTITTIDGKALVQPAFITQRNTGEPESKLVDVSGPARTITATGGNQDLVQPQFLLQTYAASSNGHNTFSVDNPARTVTTRDATHLVQTQFISHQYGNGFNTSVDEPCPTITTKERISIVDVVPSGQNQSINAPSGSIMTNDKHALVQVEPYIVPMNYTNQPTSISEPIGVITANRKWHYLVNPQFASNGASIDKPCFTLIAKMDKRPPSLVQVEGGGLAIEVYETDSPMTVKIKQFMAAYGIVDIKMRMLRVPELLRIQGFPNDYQLAGSQADQKKFIGNSVVPQVPKAWYEAMADKQTNQKQKRA